MDGPVMPPLQKEMLSVVPRPRSSFTTSHAATVINAEPCVEAVPTWLRQSPLGPAEQSAAVMAVLGAVADDHAQRCSWEENKEGEYKQQQHKDVEGAGVEWRWARRLLQMPRSGVVDAVTRHRALIQASARNILTVDEGLGGDLVLARRLPAWHHTLRRALQRQAQGMDSVASTLATCVAASRSAAAAVVVHMKYQLEDAAVRHTKAFGKEVERLALDLEMAKTKCMSHATMCLTWMQETVCRLAQACVAMVDLVSATVPEHVVASLVQTAGALEALPEEVEVLRRALGRLRDDVPGIMAAVEAGVRRVGGQVATVSYLHSQVAGPEEEEPALFRIIQEQCAENAGSTQEACGAWTNIHVKLQAMLATRNAQGCMQEWYDIVCSGVRGVLTGMQEHSRTCRDAAGVLQRSRMTGEMLTSMAGMDETKLPFNAQRWFRTAEEQGQRATELAQEAVVLCTALFVHDMASAVQCNLVAAQRLCTLAFKNSFISR